MILLFCCFLLFPIEALYKQKNLKKLIFGWHLPYRNVTDPQPCLIKSVHFNKADHYFGLEEQARLQEEQDGLDEEYFDILPIRHKVHVLRHY